MCPKQRSSPRLWWILWPNGLRLSPPPPPVIQEYWSMYFDCSFTLNGARGGMVLISPKGDRLLYVIRLHFHATTMWQSMRHWSMVCASPPNLGFSGFTSMETWSLLSIKSWESRVVATPAWLLTGKRLGSLSFPVRDYPGKMIETTWSGFDWGGMGLSLVLWRGTCPGWLSRANGDPGSTHILTRHYGAQS
jgi:hypothetical protein